MLDRKGRAIRLGDRVNIGTAETRIVVFSLDTDEFSPGFPREEWSYLGTGVMIQTAIGGLIFYDQPDEHIEVIEEGAQPS